jgi:hypothetical protein
MGACQGEVGRVARLAASSAASEEFSEGWAVDSPLNISPYKLCGDELVHGVLAWAHAEAVTLGVSTKRQGKKTHCNPRSSAASGAATGLRRCRPLHLHAAPTRATRKLRRAVCHISSDLIVSAPVGDAVSSPSSQLDGSALYTARGSAGGMGDIGPIGLLRQPSAPSSPADAAAQGGLTGQAPAGCVCPSMLRFITPRSQHLGFLSGTAVEGSTEISLHRALAWNPHGQRPALRTGNDERDEIVTHPPADDSLPSHPCPGMIGCIAVRSTPSMSTRGRQEGPSKRLFKRRLQDVAKEQAPMAPLPADRACQDDP